MESDRGMASSLSLKCIQQMSGARLPRVLFLQGHNLHELRSPNFPAHQVIRSAWTAKVWREGVRERMAGRGTEAHRLARNQDFIVREKTDSKHDVASVSWIGRQPRRIIYELRWREDYE